MFGAKILAKNFLYRISQLTSDSDLTIQKVLETDQ